MIKDIIIKNTLVTHTPTAARRARRGLSRNGVKNYSKRARWSRNR